MRRLISPYRTVWICKADPGSNGGLRVIRVSKDATMHGNMIVMYIARDQQEHGAIPAGTIASVKRVR